LKEKDKSIYESKEFIKLQLKWYRKLDNSGYNDIERTGKNRQKYFDQYSGLLSKSLSYLKHRIDSFALNHYTDLQNFAEVPNSIQILKPTTLKIPKNAHLSALKPKSSPNPNKLTILPNIVLYKPIKSNQDDQDNQDFQLIQALVVEEISLNKIDRHILKKYADGMYLKDISKFLRRYYSRTIKNKLGRPGRPFSISWVYTRLKQLKRLCSQWLAYEAYRENQDKCAEVLEIIENDKGYTIF
jgi:hypothetical protein